MASLERILGALVLVGALILVGWLGARAYEGQHLPVPELASKLGLFHQLGP